MIAFGNSQLNMIFTLFICFMILVVQEKMMASKWRIPLLILLLLLSVCSDWAILAPVFTIWFHESWGNRKRLITAFGVGAALFVLFNYSSYVEKMAAGPAMIHALLSAAGIVASGIIILCFYNGKNPKKHRSFPSGFSISFIRHRMMIPDATIPAAESRAWIIAGPAAIFST